MFTTWTAQNSGSNVPFTLSPSGWTTGDIAYEASTEAMNSGANYTAWENTSTSLVGTTCDGSHTYALVGYSMGSSLAGAAAATQTATAPSFTNMTTDKYEIVWNKTCPVTPPAPPANACATPAVVPAGYTLKNGAVGNFTLTLSPFMMYVGKPGNNNISGPAGNYIICLAAGTNTINLGAGNDTILTSNGNQTIAVGAGNSTITTGNGNSKITAGTGTDTITVGNGNNTIVGGGGASVCHVGMGVNSITGCTH
jgi:Ca2+-binding RTX toxin-like protein